MKKLLTLALALVVLAAFADLGVAQQKGKENSPPTAVQLKPIAKPSGETIQDPCKGYPQSQGCCRHWGGTWVESGSGGFCYINLRSATGVSQADCRMTGSAAQLSDSTVMCVPKGTKLMTGNVTQVNVKAKTFTVMAEGKETTLNAATLRSLPKVGGVVDVLTGPAGIMVCGRIASGDVACCAYGDGCFVYTHL